MKEGRGPYTIGQPIWEGLCKVQEESAELGVEMAKLVMTGGTGEYWEGRDVIGKMWEEVADLQAALDFFLAMNATMPQLVEAHKRRQIKLARFHRWSVEGLTEAAQGREQPEAAAHNTAAKG